MKKLSASLIIILLMTVGAYAANIFWVGYGTTGNWTNATGNWYSIPFPTQATVPSSGDTAGIYKSYYGGSYQVTTFPTISSAVPNINYLVMGGDAAGATTLTITSSGSLTAVSSLQIGLSYGSTVLNSTINNAGSLSTVDMMLGYQTGGTGTLNTSGTVTLSGVAYVGYSGGVGSLNMAGGTMSTANLAVGALGQINSGHVQLDGGVITAAYLAMYGDHSGTIDITNGVLKIAGNVDGSIGWLAGLGDITAYGDWGTVMHDITTNPGYTTVWAQANDYPSQTIEWDAGGADRLWSTRGNWPAIELGNGTFERVPRIKDIVILGAHATDSNSVIIQSGIAAEADLLQLRGIASDANLTISGGSLDVNRNCYIANGTISGARKGRINVSGGTVDVNDTLYVGEAYGNGVLSMTGGDVTCGQLWIPADKTTATGRLYLSGGTITTDYLGMHGDHSGTIDITNGTLIITGNVTAGVAWLIGQGDIIANGGADTVLYDYDVTNPGYTTVRACTSIVGDLNKDCRVNFKDFAVFASHWLEDTSD